MTIDERPDDDTLVAELRESLSRLRVAARTPLDLIVDRGRVYRRRRRARHAGLAVAAAAAGVVVVLGATGVLSAGSGSGDGGRVAVGPTLDTGTFRTAAFTLTRNANGTDTLRLTHSEMLDPTTLGQVLNAHGIPALVKTDSYCTSTPALPGPVGAGVLTVQPPGTAPPTGMAPVRASPNPAAVKRIVDRTVTVINPAKIPPGTELFFGYFGSQGLFTNLIDINAHTCRAGTAASPPGSHASSSSMTTTR